MTPTPKEECCEKCFAVARIPEWDYYAKGTACLDKNCICHSTPTTDWMERFDDTMKQLFRDFPVGTERMFIAHIRTFLQSELTRARQQTKKEIIERVGGIIEEWTEDGQFVTKGIMSQLKDLLTYLKEE